MDKVHVEPMESGNGVILRRYFAGQSMEMIDMTWPEANLLQSELRQACIDAGVTVRQ